MPLGWSLCGRDSAAKPDDIHITDFIDDDQLFRHVAEWMKLYAEGISSDKRSFSRDDKDALQTLETTTCLLDNGHYQIGLLWKNTRHLQNNYCLAKEQLQSILDHLQRKPSELQSKYEETITTDLRKGFIKQVNSNDDDNEGCWYLPHHPVTNANKPGKLRRVLNASSIYRGTSLNSILLTGPDLLCDLTGIIMQFREDQIAFSADIEAMFMQVFVTPADQPYLRFPWKDDNQNIIIYQFTRHIFGATDSPWFACYATRRCAKDNEDKYPDLVLITERNLYMDDLYKAEMQQSLTDLQQNDHFKDQCQLTGITWKFNPPAAPHLGGSWERLIKPFKDAFFKVIGTRILSDETLSTCTCEVEAVMNSWPLTTVSSEPTDTEALTPNHILLGRPSTILPLVCFYLAPSLKGKLRNKLKL